MKKTNDKIGYAIGTVFAMCAAILVCLLILGAIAIAVIKIWAFFFQLL